MEAIGNCILAFCGHPCLKVGFFLGFMLYLYYFFLISCGKLAGVYDEEISGEYPINHLHLLAYPIPLVNK